MRFRITTVLSTLILASVFLGCTPSVKSADTPDPPLMPPAPTLTDPVAAVYSYTDWISYAYQVSDSDVATHTFTSFEEVRVNSYVQYNLLEGRTIDQRLVDADYVVVESTPQTATVTGTEQWRYRYTSSDRTEYTSEPLEISYEVTYTVVQDETGRWLVDKVRAQAPGGGK